MFRCFLTTGLALGMSAIATSGRPDIDVTLPPGSPIEWLQDVPSQPSSDYRSRIPPRGGAVGRTVSDDAPINLKYGSLFSIFRVTTQDLPLHVTWIGSMPPASTPTGSGTPTGAAVKVPYPPELSDDQFWMAVIVFLRRLLHPAEVSDSEALQYLVYLGEPSLVAASAAKAEPSLGGLVETVNRSITPPPAHAPQVRVALSDKGDVLAVSLWLAAASNRSRDTWAGSLVIAFRDAGTAKVTLPERILKELSAKRKK